jgi:hypothetical protein
MQREKGKTMFQKYGMHNFIPGDEACTIDNALMAATQPGVQVATHPHWEDVARDLHPFIHRAQKLFPNLTGEQISVAETPITVGSFYPNDSAALSEHQLIGFFRPVLDCPASIPVIVAPLYFSFYNFYLLLYVNQVKLMKYNKTGIAFLPTPCGVSGAVELPALYLPPGWMSMFIIHDDLLSPFDKVAIIMSKIMLGELVASIEYLFTYLTHLEFSTFLRFRLFFTEDKGIYIKNPGQLTFPIGIIEMLKEMFSHTSEPISTHTSPPEKMVNTRIVLVKPPRLYRPFFYAKPHADCDKIAISIVDRMKIKKFMSFSGVIRHLKFLNYKISRAQVRKILILCDRFCETSSNMFSLVPMPMTDDEGFCRYPSSVPVTLFISCPSCAQLLELSDLEIVLHKKYKYHKIVGGNGIKPCRPQIYHCSSVRKKKSFFVRARSFDCARQIASTFLFHKSCSNAPNTFHTLMQNIPSSITNPYDVLTYYAQVLDPHNLHLHFKSLKKPLAYEEIVQSNYFYRSGHRFLSLFMSPALMVTTTDPATFSPYVKPGHIGNDVKLLSLLMLARKTAERKLIDPGDPCFRCHINLSSDYYECACDSKYCKTCFSGYCSNCSLSLSVPMTDHLEKYMLMLFRRNGTFVIDEDLFIAHWERYPRPANMTPYDYSDCFYPRQNLVHLSAFGLAAISEMPFCMANIIM